MLNVFREKLQSFQLPVDDDCWDGIQTRMQTKKSHKILPFWWWTSGGAAAIITLLLSISVFRNAPEIQTPDIAFKKTEQHHSDKNVSAEQPTLAQVYPTVKQSSSIQKKGTAQADNSETVRSDESVQSSVEINNVPTQNEHAAKKSEDKSVVRQEEQNIAEIEKRIDATDKTTQPVDDWTENIKNQDKKSEWFLAANAGTGSSNSASTAQSPLFTDATLFRVTYAAANKSAVQLNPEDFAEKKYSTPISVGIMVGKSLAKNLSIASGLKYTILHTSLSESNTEADFTLHYLGIPVQLIYNVYSTGGIGFYISGGGMLEKGLSSVFEQHQNWGTDVTTTKDTKKIDGVQLSVSAAPGLNYSFTKNIQFYAQPDFSYFFNNNQPLSIRTTQPVVISINAGLKITL